MKQFLGLTVMMIVLGGVIFLILELVEPFAQSHTITPTPIRRDVTLSILSGANESDLFHIYEIYDLRNREGFLVLTHQSYFWQEGDKYSVDSLAVDVVFDDSIVIDEPFVFWPNSSRYEDVNSNGYYMATPMNISVDTSGLAIGQHTVMVQVTTPHNEVFSHTWGFMIDQREVARQSTPPEIVPTADYLLDNSLPTPDYISGLPTETHILDRFSPLGSTEGICIGLDLSIFIPINATQDLFNPPFSNITPIEFFIDGINLPENLIGQNNSSSICFSTDFLAEGTHLAEIIFKVNEIEYSYQWAFIVR